jgi:hypothetical protein
LVGEVGIWEWRWSCERFFGGLRNLETRIGRFWGSVGDYTEHYLGRKDSLVGREREWGWRD